MNKSKMKKLEYWIIGDSELLSVGKENILLQKIEADRFSFILFRDNNRIMGKEYTLVELKKIFVEA